MQLMSSMAKVATNLSVEPQSEQTLFYRGVAYQVSQFRLNHLELMTEKSSKWSPQSLLYRGVAYERLMANPTKSIELDERILNPMPESSSVALTRQLIYRGVSYLK